MREKARVAVFKNIAATFKTAIRLAHSLWKTHGKPRSTRTVVLEGGVIVGVTPNGWPVNGVFGTAEGSAEGCTEVWNSVLSKNSSMASVTDREMFQASFEAPICTYNLNTRPGYRITYNLETGGVAVVTKIKFK